MRAYKKNDRLLKIGKYHSLILFEFDCFVEGHLNHILHGRWVHVTSMIGLAIDKRPRAGIITAKRGSGLYPQVLYD